VALAILGGALFTVAVAAALGALLLGGAARDIGLRFLTGAAALSTAVFLLCAAGAARPWVFAAFGIVVLGTVTHALVRAAPALVPALGDLKRKRAGAYATAAAFFAYLLLYLPNAMAPEFSYDGSRYHLGLVSRYLREHGFHRITDNLYACLSQGIEMLYLYAFAFGRHSAAAVVHLAFLLALAWMMLMYSRRAGFPWTGAAAALLVFASPAVGVNATSAYIDVAVAAVAFALFWLLQLWDESRSPRLLVAIGLVAGFAYAAKYTAWLAVPYALGFVAWKSRRVRDVAVVAALASVLIAPWMLKNWLWVGNPVAPFYNAWFPNPYFTVAFEREYRAHMLSYGLASRWQLPLLATTYGSLSGLLGPVFLLSPIALLSLVRREGRQLLLAALVFGAGYFSNIGTRFLIPALPFAALAMLLALRRYPRAVLALALVHAVISWPSMVRRYSKPDAWRLAKIPWREALRIKPEEGFLYSNLPDYGVTRMVEQRTAPGSTVLSFTPIPEAYTSRYIRVPYESAEGVADRATFFTGFAPDYAPTWQLRFSFPRQNLRALRVVQTSRGKDTWSVTDLRVFDGTRQLSDAGWKWTAHPNPWESRNAGDGNPATFWLCGDTMRAGQFLEIDFPAPEAADSLRIDAAPNQWEIRLELEGRNEAGAWKRLSAAPESTQLPTPPNLRRAAAAELKRRGVDYLLLFDHEFGAADLRNNPEWGVSEAGESRGARLYRLPTP
jgi:hypothetical protein